MQITLDKFGRILIPKKIRQELGLRPGENLELEQSNGKIVLRPISNDEHLVYEQGVLVHTGQPESDLSDAIETQRQERIKKLWNGLG